MKYLKFPSIWVNENQSTCRYVDYLLGIKFDEISSTNILSRINWSGIFSVNTLFFIVILIPLG